MDSFNYQNIQIEKANAIRRYRSFQKITMLFRLTELCVILIMISRFFTTQLTIFFKLFGEFFQWLSVTLVSPRFIFIIGNAIIVVLYLKSGQHSAQGNAEYGRSLNLCDDYAESTAKNQNIYGQGNKKQSMFEDIRADKYSSKQRKIYRNGSEIFERLHNKGSCYEVRRSVMENYRENVNYGEKSARVSYVDDEMSNEEFRQFVEAFIARQQRFLREEEFAAVVSF